MKIKIDLHTHCFEAIGIFSPESVTPLTVEKIIDSVKRKGLDGIAITEHYESYFGFVAQKIVAEYFDNQVLIIPGHEIYYRRRHTVELFLPGNTVFRFLPHPMDDQIENDFDFGKLHGIEINNSQYNQSMDKPRIRALAEKHNLILLSNSDAHDLNDVGYYYNEIDLDDLINRVRHHTESEVNDC